MEKVMRGHHLLCVHGFQGMGYSPEFVEKMKAIVTDIRNDSLDFPIRVVADFDEACGSCPHRGIERCEASHDSHEHVLSMDNKTIQHLGIEKNQLYLKSELVALTAKKVSANDLDYLCAGCTWLAHGVCKDGIEKLQKKFGKA